MPRTRVHNIFADIEKRKSQGFTHVDANGNYQKEETLKSKCFRIYGYGVKRGEIDPLNIPFETYFSKCLGNYLNIDDIIKKLTDYLTERSDSGHVV